MTIALSLWFFTRCVVIADSRISYPDKKYPPRDLLQKIYPIGSHTLGMRAVISFSGPLSGAYAVMRHARDVAKKTQEPSDTAELLRAIIDPLKDKYQELTNDQRHGLSFMLVGVEPARDISTNRPDWVPFAPTFLGHVLKPSEDNSAELRDEPLGLVSAIGLYDNGLISKCESLIQGHIQLMGQSPEAGAHLLRSELMLEHMLNDSEYVGGLFQHAELSANGLRMLDYSTTNGVALRYERDIGRFVIDDGSGNPEPLISIFDRVQWSRGRFFPQGMTIEDPMLRQVVEIIVGKQKGTTLDGEV